MNWQSIETAPKDGTDLILSFEGQFGWVIWVGRMGPDGLIPDGHAAPEYWMPLPNPPKQYSASIGAELAEEIDACLSFIRHNKVYEELEEADVEAYNMAETLIETLRDKLEEETRISTLRGNMIEFELTPSLHDTEQKLKDTEKSRDQWRSMWEKTKPNK